MENKQIFKQCIYFIFLIGIQNPFCVLGQNWQPLGTGLPSGGDPRVIFADTIDNYLYVAGSFDSVGGTHARGIARWNNSTWDSLASGVDKFYFGAAPIYSIARYNNELYVGGSFTFLGDLLSPRLGKWNGTNWDTVDVKPFSNNFGGGVTSLTVIGNELYIGGSFDSIVDQPCQSIASWNGANWNLIGLPPIINYSYDPRVNAICQFNGEIYMGGNFASYLPLSMDSVMDIIRWDGVNWKSVGGGMKGGWSGVNKMLVYQGELYVAGSFFEFDGNVGNNIQRWNGIQWTEVGGGTWGSSALSGQILDMIVYNNKLYVVGNFTIAGGIQANNIAVWDGTNWCGLGSTFDNGLQTLGYFDDTLYVGGGFSNIDGDTIHKIAQWTAGNYVEQCGNNAIVASYDNLMSIDIYPNPTTNIINIILPQILNNENTNFIIYNSYGEKVNSGIMNTDIHQLDFTYLPNGFYFIEFIIGNKSFSKKIIKTN